MDDVKQWNTCSCPFVRDVPPESGDLCQHHPTASLGLSLSPGWRRLGISGFCRDRADQDPIATRGPRGTQIKIRCVCGQACREGVPVRSRCVRVRTRVPSSVLLVSRCVRGQPAEAGHLSILLPDRCFQSHVKKRILGLWWVFQGRMSLQH